MRSPFTPRQCGRREYATWVALEIAGLLAAAFWLAHVAWFQHQPISLRAAIVTGMAYLSAASVDRLRPLSAATAPTRAVAAPNPATESDPED
jgi:phosphate/sulfate permease